MLDNLMGTGASLSLVALLVALVCLWVAAVRSILRDPGLSNEGKVGWMIAVFVAPFLGVIAWYATRSWTRS
ncbi:MULTISPECIES: PLDc N-terminal domain-containing protein [unclassified Curtobacterium]|uniref:PLDc N-terminal domain-containing protein n=1 Tax=unclassified Curtobacterium TaxID=257496 RepID=UPI00034D9560|nr:PLDc N-terminal domain-containing protein [Curtobacterium sp. B18]